MKPDTKGHMLYDSIYNNCPEQENPQINRLMVTRGWRKGERGVTANNNKDKSEYQ